MSRRRCEVCGKEDLIPFKCSYCGKFFCAEHRLPEKHDCASLPKIPPPYIVEKFERALPNEVSDGLERVKNTIIKRSRIRKGFLDKVEESRVYQFLLILIVIGSVASLIVVPDVLSHHYLKHIDFFRFHLAQITSFMQFAMGTGWLIIGYGIPLLIPLSAQSLILCLAFYGSLALLFLSYKAKGKKGILLTFIIMLSALFTISEYGRLSTSDFQTIDELTTFLHHDDTNAITYTSDFKCIDFSLTLIERAKDIGRRLYFASDGSHAFCEAYIVTKCIWVEIEPQTDEFWR